MPNRNLLTQPKSTELSWDDVSADQIGPEVGYRLIPLVDAAQGGTFCRIKGVEEAVTRARILG